MVRLGLVARADDRGIGLITWELARAMHPERVLVVREPGAEARGFQPHLDRYPGATVVQFAGGQLPEQIVRDWLAGLDVVLAIETFYEWQMVRWAAEAGVATVLMAMPEFFHPGIPRVDALWAPTPWRIDSLPDARLVPVPVAADRFPMCAPARGVRLRVLHVAGHRAAADRNGTLQTLAALRFLTQPVVVTVATQDERLPNLRGLARGVEVRRLTGGVADYWQLYADADVLVMPRGYGGLSLPVQEAMAAGLAVVMTDCPPNDWWPTVRVPAKPRARITTAAGSLPIFQADPRQLAACIDRLAADEGALAAAQAGSVGWAREHSWDALRPLYEAELARAAEAAHRRA